MALLKILSEMETSKSHVSEKDGKSLKEIFQDGKEEVLRSVGETSTTMDGKTRFVNLMATRTTL